MQRKEGKTRRKVSERGVSGRGGGGGGSESTHIKTVKEKVAEWRMEDAPATHSRRGKERKLGRSASSLTAS
jgi:hypothetical protein